MIESFLLVSSVCIDCFVASIAYGTNKIRIPILSALIISFIGSFVLGLSLFLGSFLKDLLPSYLCVILSFLILMIIGLYRFFEGIFKSFINKRCSHDKPFKFKIFDFYFILQVYADETKADFDKSKTLSLKEATYLAFALSFDSIAVGFGSSLVSISLFNTIILCFVVGLCLILLGVFLGKKIVEKTNINLSWLSGLILMILATLKLF